MAVVAVVVMLVLLRVPSIILSVKRDRVPLLIRHPSIFLLLLLLLRLDLLYLLYLLITS